MKLTEQYQLVQCKHPRCFSGKDKTKCKYSFPKPESETTYYDEDGKLIYKRKISDTKFVEHCPALLLLWGAHAHVHILRCSDYDSS